MVTAFVLAHPVVMSVLLGPRTPAHLESSLAGAGVRLADLLGRIRGQIRPTSPRTTGTGC